VVNSDNQFSAFIYPNPATNNATLKVEGLKDKAQVTVYDIQGRQIVQVNISVAGWAKGVYNVRIVAKNNQSLCRKLIVQ
jgi:hypothetical protein